MHLNICFILNVIKIVSYNRPYFLNHVVSEIIFFEKSELEFFEVFLNEIYVKLYLDSAYL